MKKIISKTQKYPFWNKKVIHFFFFIGLLSLVNAFGQTIQVYVDLNDPHGAVNETGEIATPFRNIGDAVWTANQTPDTPVAINIQGASYESVYLSFAERTTDVALKSYGTGYVIYGSAAAVNYSGFLLAANAGGYILSIDGVEFYNASASKVGNFGLYLNGSDTSDFIVKNCTFNGLYWTDSELDWEFPSSNADYFHPIVYTGNSLLSLEGNTFTNIAPGFGDLVWNSDASAANTDILAGNIFTNIYRPWSAATATEFYIDDSVQGGTGTDVNGDRNPVGSGSKSDPWKFLTAVNFGAIFNDWSTGKAVPVDKDVTLYFAAGRHMLKNVISMSNISAASSLTLKPAPGAEGRVVLDGSGITSQWQGIIACTDCNNLTIEGLKLQNLVCNQSYSMDTRFGIIINGSGNNIVIKDNEISDMHWSNRAYDKLNPLPTNNLGAIQVLGTKSTPITNLVITNNNVHDITPGWTEAITVNANVDGFEISNNTVTDIANIGIVVAGNYAWVLNQEGATVTATDNYTRNGVISKNTVSRCISPIAISAGIYVDGAENITVTYNTSSENGAGISIGNEQHNSTSGGHTVTGNTFENNIDAGMYIGSTTTDSMVEDVMVNANTSRNNYNDAAALIAKANGNYGGGEKSADLKIYRITNLDFRNNNITSLSETVMLKDFYGLHKSNHSYTNNTYTTVTNTPATSQFIYADTGNTGSWTILNFCEHQEEGFDLDSTAGIGDCDTLIGTGSYDTPDLSLTELNSDSYIVTKELVSTGDSVNIEIDGYLRIISLDPSINNKGYKIAHAMDSYTIETTDASENHHYFLAPSSYNTNGFPDTYPTASSTIELVLPNAAVVENDIDLSTTTLSLYKSTNTGPVQVSGVNWGEHYLPTSFAIKPKIFEESSNSNVVVYVSDAIYNGVKYYEKGALSYDCVIRSMKSKNIAIFSECLVDTNILSENKRKIVIDVVGNVSFYITVANSVLSTMISLNDRLFDLIYLYTEPSCVASNIEAVEQEGGIDCSNHEVAHSFWKVVLKAGVDSGSFVHTLAGDTHLYGKNMSYKKKQTSCDEVINYPIASPFLLGYTASEVTGNNFGFVSHKYQYAPISSETYTIANTLQAKPYVAFKNTLYDTQYILPALSLSKKATSSITWKKGTDETCSVVLQKENNSNNNVGLPMVIGLPIGTTGSSVGMPSDLGWVALVDQNDEQIIVLDPTSTSAGAAISLKLYTYTTGYQNKLVQFIPTNAVVWTSVDVRTGDNYSLAINSTSNRSTLTDKKISKTPETNKILVYPNPTSNSVTIKLSNTSDAQIFVYDIRGLQVQQLDYTKEHINTGLQVDLESYRAGLYLIKTIQNSDSFIHRVVKQLL